MSWSRTSTRRASAILRQRGMASIVITLITMVIISLIVLGFATISRREQRQTLDQQLSAQAFYAAESAVEDARHVIKTSLQNGTRLVGRTNCVTNDPGGTYPTGGGMVVDADNGVSYTCLKVNLAPGDLVYDGVGESGVAIPVTTPGNTDRIRITWKPASAVNGTPDGCPGGTTGAFKPQPDWNCEYGLLRAELVATKGALTRAGLAGSQFTGHFIPSKAGGPGTVSYAGNTGRPVVQQASCGTTAYTECSMTINGLAGADEFALRLSSLYQTSDITISAFCTCGTKFNLSGTQVEIDATGKAQDVLRRIKVRIPIRGGGELPPNYAIQSSGSICKRFASAPGFFQIPGDITEQDPTNALCQPRISTTPPPPPRCLANADVVIVADTSSSMRKSWNTMTRIQKLQQVARRFINETSISNAENHAALVGFDIDGTMHQTLTGNTGALNNAVDALDSLGNGTNYMAGLRVAEPEFFGPRVRPGSPKVLLFISDGAPNREVNGILAKTDELKSKGIRIYTVAIGDVDDPQDTLDEALLRGMAGNGGDYSNAEREADLDWIIKSISNELNCTP